MNDVGVAQAIIARLKTDMGSGGLWETAGVSKLLSITSTDGPVMATSIPAITPYLVLRLINFQQDDTYDGDSGTYQWQLDLVDDHGNGNTLGEDRGRAIGVRIFGDAIAQTGRIPTYGMHRHKLVLTTTGDAGAPWSAGVMYRTGVTPLHEVDVYRWAHSYEVRIQRVHA